MSLTKTQRARRGCPAVLGVSPYMSRFELYVDKTAGLPEKTGSHLDTGNRLETALLRFCSEQIGQQVTIKNRLRVHENGFMHANLDGLVVGKREGIECKTVQFGDVEQWGEEGTNQIPDHVQAQAQHQMYVAELDLVWVPVLMPRYEWRIYKVERHDKLIETIVDREREFWHNHVLAQVPPNEEPSLEALKYLRRVPEKIATVPAELVAEWEAAKSAATESKKAAEEAQRKLLAALGDAEGGDFGDPAKILTYYEACRAAYQVPESKYRTLRISKKKG